MEHNQEAHSMTFVSGFLLGAMVGAGIALLTAPEAGMRTRKRIRKRRRRVEGLRRRSLGRSGRGRQG